MGTTTGTSISLLWSAATDNVAVTAYDVFRNGSAAATVTQPSANVTGLTCGTTHGFEVEARDAAGNRSTRAAVTASTSPCPDAQPPTAPTGVNATSRTATSIALSWSPSTDNVGVAGYGLYRGTSRTTTTGTSWVVSGLTCNTNYTLSVDAFDASGNQSSRTTVMVATTACPDTAAPTAPSNLAASGVTATGLTLTWGASTDNVGVTGYDVYRNGTKVASGNTTSSTQSGLSCGTSYAFAVEALDAAGNRSGRGQLNASTGGCPPTPPPPPPPPAGCAVNPATMTAPGCTLKRDDTGVAANPEAGLWGQIGAASPSRHEHVTSGGDPYPRATGGAQGNSAFRRLTVQDGDDFFGARAELGRNTTTPYYTEATGTSTAGTFAVYREGERRITFWSQRYGTGFTATASNWQTVMQMKQQQPYAANGPVDSAPALEVQLYGGRVRLHSFWSSVWTTTAPVLGQWVRYAVDVTYSQDPAKGRVQMFVDANADGDFLDAGEVSPVLTMRTLAYVTSSGSSPIAPGGSLPSHLRLGIYHHSSYGTTTVDLDNVQVVG